MSSDEQATREETQVAKESRTERRIHEAFEDLPDPYSGNRPWRSPLERISRYLEALRRRLDHLVTLEEQQGDEQPGAGYKRAERNALIWALQQLAPAVKGIELPLSLERKANDPGYVDETFARISDLGASGFTRVDRRRPGWLLHKHGDDIAPVETSLTIWFYFAAKDPSLTSRKDH